MGRRWRSGANECKVLIPLQFSLMMNTVPKGQIFFSHTNSPTSSAKNESYNSKLYTSMKFGLVFSGHILSLQQTYYCVVCERLKRKNGKATSTVWRQPYSIKHVDPTFPIQYIEFWISRQPAHSTIEQRGKVIYFHCQSIVPFPTFEVK